MSEHKKNHHEKNHHGKQDDGKRMPAGQAGKAEGEKPGVAPSASRSDGMIEVPAQEYETLKKRAEELEGMREKLLHAAADFENAKKRNARDKEDFIKFSQERILREMLPALDNFERALNHATAAGIPESNEETLRKNLKSLTAGVQMVQKNITDVLKANGLVRLKALGEKFDPHLHEVVGYVTEDGEEDRIVDELEAGYKLHEKLLRAAKVRIRVSPESKAAAQDKQDEIT
jgi:molecular chaperone GrpE